MSALRDVKGKLEPYSRQLIIYSAIRSQFKSFRAGTISFLTLTAIFYITSISGHFSREAPEKMHYGI